MAVYTLVDRVINAAERLRGRTDLSSQILLLVLIAPGIDPGMLLDAVETAEKMFQEEEEDRREEVESEDRDLYETGAERCPPRE